MLSVFRFLSFRKSILVALPLVVIGAYAVHEAAGDEYGVIGYSKVGCSSCHGPLSKSTVVKISTSATQIVAGQTYVFQFSVSNPADKGAGCDISVDNGAKLAVSGSGLQVYNNELTHTQPLAFTGDSAVWTFKYTAPTKTGIAHIYAAGNAVNLNGEADEGDISDTTSYIVNVVAPSGPQISSPAIVRDTVLRGDTVQTSFWVKNAGNAILNINHYSLRLGAFFSIIDSSAHTIAVGDSAQITYRFIPGNGATYTDSLHVYSNDELTPISSTALVGLSTSGVFHVAVGKTSTNTVNFGQVNLTHSDTMAVTISNTGNGLLTISPKSLTLANSDFVVVSINPASIPPYEIAPKGTVIVTVAFSPSKIGTDTATFPLTVSEYEDNSIDTSIVLIGTGIPNASVDPEIAGNISFVISPNPSSGIFNLSSTGITGAADVEISDPAGRIVAKEEITLQSESSINLSGLPNGTYFLSVRPQNGQPFMRRIVIER